MAERVLVALEGWWHGAFSVQHAVSNHNRARRRNWARQCSSMLPQSVANHQQISRW